MARAPVSDSASILNRGGGETNSGRDDRRPACTRGDRTNDVAGRPSFASILYHRGTGRRRRVEFAVTADCEGQGAGDVDLQPRRVAGRLPQRRSPMTAAVDI